MRWADGEVVWPSSLLAMIVITYLSPGSVSITSSLASGPRFAGDIGWSSMVTVMTSGVASTVWSVRFHKILERVLLLKLSIKGVLGLAGGTAKLIKIN